MERVRLIYFTSSFPIYLRKLCPPFPFCRLVPLVCREESPTFRSFPFLFFPFLFCDESFCEFFCFAITSPFLIKTQEKTNQPQLLKAELGLVLPIRILTSCYRFPPLPFSCFRFLSARESTCPGSSPACAASSSFSLLIAS